jgi:hypothetical protein
MNFVDKVGILFDDTGGVTLKFGPFSDDCVIMTVSHGSIEKVQQGSVTSVARRNNYTRLESACTYVFMKDMATSLGSRTR